MILFFKITLLLLLTIPIVSCAGLFNPYEESFTCPAPGNGKCVSINQAYTESLNGSFDENGQRLPDSNNSKQPVSSTKKNCKRIGLSRPTFRCKETKEVIQPPSQTEEQPTVSVQAPSQPQPTHKDLYRQDLYDRMSSMLQEPQAPVMAMPKTLRVMIVPYKGSQNEFYGARYTFIMVEEPTWIMEEF